MTYREHPLGDALAPFVECAWSLRAPRARAVRVVPDGCLDVIVDLSPAPVRPDRGLRRFAVGTMTRALVLRPSGPVDVVGVRFRPGAARPFLGPSAAELTDGVVPLEDLWGRTAVRLAERMASAGLEARLGLLAEALRARVPGSDDPGGFVRAACRILARRGFAVAVGDLADELGVGRRRLERAFRREVGLAPARTRGVLRFRRALGILEADPDAPLAAVALRAGYHDQPHFTREFRRLAGVPPTAWLAERAGVASVQDPASSPA